MSSEIRETIFNIIQDATVKKEDIAKPFMKRVPDNVAKDYRDIIAGEMFIELILERIINDYYRSVKAILADFDQIGLNARIYNGEDHPLTIDAKKLIEQIKRQIRGLYLFN